VPQLPKLTNGGLTRRTVLASTLLALLIGGVFLVLLLANFEQRDARRLARHSRTEVADAQRLLRLLVDLETGQRGFVITRVDSFLEPWNKARTEFPKKARALAAFVDDPAQARLAARIAQDGAAYIRDYSVPLVNAVRRNDPSAQRLAGSEVGKQRVDDLRALFQRFTTTEQASVTAGQNRVDAAANRGLVVATIGLGGSILLIALFSGYFARAVVLPIRRAAAMAGRLAGGDLAVRMPESGAAEVGELERAFNTMGSSLEANQDELAASRARVLAAADGTRRRIERDLHDGAQQRVVHTVISLKLARKALAGGDDTGPALVDEALTHAELANAQLRDLVHGILPGELRRGGLRPGVEALVQRAALPVSADVTGERMSADLEATAYFIVAEALTNVIKHAGAGSAQISAVVEDHILRLEVRDDGVGGARLDGSTGLLGLQDRAAALNGELRVESPPGGGTVVTARLPVPG
jgi:signal transduction histidine kinase